MWTKEKVDNTIQIIMQKASTDLKFRKSVIADPEKAIFDITGENIPEGFKIKVIENYAGYDQTFVLNEFMEEELSDEELDNVAGGRGRCTRDCGRYTDCYCNVVN
jgi:hypothetical protein